MSITVKDIEISPFRMVRYLFKHMVILFWGVSLIPFYMSWVFASHELIIAPSWETEFLDLFLGFLVVGPFLGGSTLLFNDYWDYDVDRISKRKSEFPLPKGLVPRSTVLKLSIAFMVIAIVVSLIIEPVFAVIISICIFLSIIYSAPPIRVKGRPGFDVILNSTGAGILCSLGGWSLVEPLSEYPFWWLVAMFFGVAAIYIPTTIIDHDSDEKKGIATLAVRLGTQRAFYLGLVCITMANSAVMVMGLRNYLITPEFVHMVWPIAVLQVFFYWLILRKQTYKNVFITIGGLAALLTIGNGLILLYYTGHLQV
jgi:lycopene elongase/hydratase (dihydrobisanhydrobacterioruberin-forming)